MRLSLSGRWNCPQNGQTAGHEPAPFGTTWHYAALRGTRVPPTLVGGGVRKASGESPQGPFHAQNPGLTNRNTFDDVRSWTLTLTLKRLFGS